MPWTIVKGGGKCSIDEYAVIKKSDGSTAGCHPTPQAAKKQLAALYAQEKGSSSKMRSVQAAAEPEQRGLPADVAALEIRTVSTGDDAQERFSGYAAVYGTRAAIGNPKTVGFYEQIAPSAFNRTLSNRSDVRMLIDHNPYYVVSRISAGSLNLASDHTGLAVDSVMDPELSYVRDLKANVRNRNITGMSFGFKVPQGGDSWTRERSEDGQDVEVRTLHEVKLIEVSAVTFPAYAKTQAELHTVAAALRARGDLDAIERRAQYRPELWELCGIDPELRRTIIDLGGGERRAHSTATSDGPWDAAANEKKIPNDASSSVLREEYAYVPSSDASKSDCKFPHHFVSSDGTPGAASTVACSTGIAALNGGRGGADLPGGSRQSVYSHLAAHLRSAGKTPPELKRSDDSVDATRTDDAPCDDCHADPAVSTQLSGPSVDQRMRVLAARFHLPVS